MYTKVINNQLLIYVNNILKNFNNLCFINSIYKLNKKLNRNKKFIYYIS